VGHDALHDGHALRWRLAGGGFAVIPDLGIAVGLLGSMERGVNLFNVGRLAV
jgi:hypothetical protein